MCLGPRPAIYIYANLRRQDKDGRESRTDDGRSTTCSRASTLVRQNIFSKINISFYLVSFRICTSDVLLRFMSLSHFSNRSRARRLSNNNSETSHIADVLFLQFVYSIVALELDLSQTIHVCFILFFVFFFLFRRNTRVAGRDFHMTFILSIFFYTTNCKLSHSSIQ